MFSTLLPIELFDDDNFNRKNTQDNESSERYDILCNRSEISLLVLQAFNCSLEKEVLSWHVPQL
jgi:hypothetical protein